MTVRSWMVKSWPQVRLQVTDDFRGMPEFQHISTLWREDTAGREGRVGETVWAARLGNQDVVGLAWEWVEVRPGLVALPDRAQCGCVVPVTLENHIFEKRVDLGAQLAARPGSEGSRVAEFILAISNF